MLCKPVRSTVKNWKPPVKKPACRNLLTALGMVRGSNWDVRLVKIENVLRQMLCCFPESAEKNHHTQCKISILEKDFCVIEAILGSFILAESQMILQDIHFQWNEGFLVPWTAHSVQQKSRSELIKFLYTKSGKYIRNFTLSDNWLDLFVACQQLSFHRTAKTRPLGFFA